MPAKEKITEEKISFLRNEYAQGLRSRFLDIYRVYLNFLDTNKEVEGMQNLEVLSHTLAGSAGTFGFGYVAAYCKKIEQLAILLSSDFQNKKILHQLSITIFQLEQEIENPRLSKQMDLLVFTSTSSNHIIYICF